MLIPDDEMMENAILTAVGAGPTVMAGKAATEAAWLGVRELFTREALETGAGAAAGVTADNVLPRALVQAEHRAEIAADNLAGPMHPAPVGAAAEHPLSLGGGEHSAPPISHESPLAGAGPHESPLPAGDVAPPATPGFPTVRRGRTCGARP